MKTTRLILAIVMSMALAGTVQAQTLLSDKASATGDYPHIRMNNADASTTTNDKRSTIWLDNDGKLKFRSVAGYGFAFRNASNMADILTVSNSGAMGMGVASPSSRLQLADDSFITLGSYTNSNNAKGIHFTGFRDTQPNYFGASIEAEPAWSCCGGFPSGGYAGIKNINLNFYVHYDSNIANSKRLAMAIHNSGNVGIGIASPADKLAVNGNIRAKEVKVETANWPDYVFEEGYRLTDLDELAAYIKANKHLPGMPSAKEAEAEGMALGEMNRKLLEKVEELTLHLLEERRHRESVERRLESVTEKLESIDKFLQ